MDRRLMPAMPDVKTRRVLDTRRSEEPASGPTTEPLTFEVTAALRDANTNSPLMKSLSSNNNNHLPALYLAQYG